MGQDQTGSGVPVKTALSHWTAGMRRLGLLVIEMSSLGCYLWCIPGTGGDGVFQRRTMSCQSKLTQHGLRNQGLLS